MTFNSVEYAILLLTVVALYWRLPRRPQNVMVLVASYIFYGAWDARFLSLLAISTLTDYTIGRAMGGPDDTEPRRRRLLLLISLAVNLGILGFFKYYGFFVASATGLLSSMGLEPNPPLLQVVLPVGISFYTFQSLSYTIDIYRGRLHPTSDLLDFATYVAFFPQLVAGPIERAQRLLPQLAASRPTLTTDRAVSGLTLICVGLVKKVVIADGLAPFVNQAFSGSSTAGWIELLLGAYAFSLQIYGDFSGYSSIARGSARLLGIELMRNFEQPYLSRNITHFWRTWHVSLSSWLRDYLYIPLGGNRGSTWQTQRNLMITMLLGGLWHGAAWTFVAWGALHGSYLAVHRSFRDRSPIGALDPPRWSDAGAILVTFHLVTLTWIPFRAASWEQVTDYLAGLLTLRAGSFPWDGLSLLVPMTLAVLLFDLAQRRSGSHTPVLAWRPSTRGLALGGAAVAFLLFSGQPAVPFIYFQF